MPVLPPLTREELSSVIEGQAQNLRVPLLIHLWARAGGWSGQVAGAQAILERYPMDAQYITASMPGSCDAPEDDPAYRWVKTDRPAASESIAYDNNPAITDWDQLDAALAAPDPDYPNLIPQLPEADGRYRLGIWWGGLFESHWGLRGMTNALTDYYTNPDEVHRLFRALTDFFKRAIMRMRQEGTCDGVLTSDDIGMQTGPFFSLSIFREFFLPYYREIFDTAHSNGMHFWLHACGNIQPFLPDLIEAGLDVIHPIQKYTMDERKIAARFGGKIAFWAGMDVQQTIPWGTPDDVRREVRFMIDTYRRREGRLLLTAGNGVTPDCPLASMEAFFDEAVRYGA